VIEETFSNNLYEQPIAWSVVMFRSEATQADATVAQADVTVAQADATVAQADATVAQADATVAHILILKCIAAKSNIMTSHFHAYA